MSDSELETAEGTTLAEDRLDEDDRLKPEFVSAVMERVEAGDDEGARTLVEPLHPADIADLLELVDRDDRRALAKALSGILDGDVLAEMNDWVRDELIEALEPHEVAEIAGEMETDDAVAIIEDMEEEDQRAVLRALDPDDRGATRSPCPSIGPSARSSISFAPATTWRRTSGKCSSSIPPIGRSAPASCPGS